MKSYNINPLKLNVLIVGQTHSGYNINQISQDTKAHLSENFAINEDMIDIHVSHNIPLNNAKGQAMQESGFDILLFGKNSIYKNRGGANVFIDLLKTKGSIGTFTNSKGNHKYRELQSINRSNLKQAINEAASNYLGYGDYRPFPVYGSIDEDYKFDDYSIKIDD